MAGGHESKPLPFQKRPLHKDPAIIKWNNMTVNRHKYFRWTKRTALINIAYVIVVPATLGYFGYMTEVSVMSGEKRTRANVEQGKWDMRGKRRGDTISEF
ncbi:hypothetical protein N0V95_008569 [Ascochyta clinopodiicola]|nr:hypothetical protein N0V95_008569 [Ascochyta clinopodiicola]